MNRLIELSNSKIAKIDTKFVRSAKDDIDTSQRLIIILGHRGVGKTTLLLQMMKRQKNKSIYLSLDDIFFESNRLIEYVDELYANGYRRLFLDEVHRYIKWSADLKNIYDNYPDIHVLATGSSILELHKGQADLSRRASIMYLPGLSFREFIEFEYHIKISQLQLEALIERHQEISVDYYDMVEMEIAFKKYLRYGYFPFYKESLKQYPIWLQETTRLVIDVDIAQFEELTFSTIHTMKKLLYMISQSVPFVPNISKLSDKLGSPRNSILRLLDLLDRAGVLNLLRSETKGISYLQKPEKIYLQNTNLIYSISEGKPNIGNIRETFFLSQLQVKHEVTYPRYGDFMVNNNYVFEVGGPSKNREHLKGIPKSFIAADGLKGGDDNRIPLWLFGFLY